ncbi:putative serine/threonine-protein kinase-like protein CCR3 [Punica granatum]|nr:putative serine/threonine-protein kinase-like protein CCR3 [Punica granatum]OWM66696.1 hypothetical protein CDL15_Pgr010347 [Punica granatum]
MKKLGLQPSRIAVALAFVVVALTSPSLRWAVHALGSAATAAAVSGTGTVCGIVAGQRTQGIQCFHSNRTLWVRPSNASFESVAGGDNLFCGLRSGGFSLLCWDTLSGFLPRRLYYSKTVRLTALTVGDDQVCAVEVNAGIARCWRGQRGKSLFPAPEAGWKFRTLTSGSGFTCGILESNSRVLCWGRDPIGALIQSQFGNSSMWSLVAGESHACGISVAGILICQGNNDHGQLDVPFSSAFEFSELALGAKFSCAMRRRNGLAVCWGGETGRFEYDYNVVEGLSFEAIFAGLDFVCGLVTGNLTVTCWGPGWYNRLGLLNNLPLGMIIPGPCLHDPCSRCGPFPNSNALCGGSGNICRSCQVGLPFAVPLPPAFPSPSIPSSPSNDSETVSSKRTLSRLSIGFVIVGSVGVLAGTCTIVYCFWCGVCGLCRKKSDCSEQNPNPEAHLESRVHTGSNIGILRLVSERSYWSGSSSLKHVERTENFPLEELAIATNRFSHENMVGRGSFGIVYKGKLPDGREVAIKRGETGARMKKFQEKETAFGSELALLTRLHHKHLVGLVGYCQEDDERLLVYEYMRNGALHDHLHGKDNVERSSSVMNSWKMRVRVALDAARGIEYLHSYAVPPIIHRDIKSSNILLDTNWTARVSDFGLSLMGPEAGQEYTSSRAVGTVGYIDPEYYVMNVLTTKSDVYGLGVVLLELLTGRRAVFKEEDGMAPIGVVEYAVPAVLAGELRTVLDRRVGQLPPRGTEEARAVELVVNVAVRCVNLEGKDRPTVGEVVAELERALAFIWEDNSHGSLSNSTYSISSE